MADKRLQLSAGQKQLLRKHFGYYRQLDSGERAPVCMTEEHFVAVCRGLAEPVTEHELAYVAFKRSLRSKDLAVEEIGPAGSEPMPDAAPSSRELTAGSSHVAEHSTSSICWACNGAGYVPSGGAQRMRCSQCRGTGDMSQSSVEDYERFGSRDADSPPGFIYRDNRYGNRKWNA